MSRFVRDVGSTTYVLLRPVTSSFILESVAEELLSWKFLSRRFPHHTHGVLMCDTPSYKQQQSGWTNIASHSYLRNPAKYTFSSEPFDSVLAIWLGCDGLLCYPFNFSTSAANTDKEVTQQKKLGKNEGQAKGETESQARMV